MTQSYATYSNVKTRLNLPSDTNQTFITQLCTNANEYIEFYCRRSIGPTAGGTATFDANRDVFNGELYVRDGVRAITSLTVADSTGETPGTATAGDLIILPRSQNRRPGWPGFWVGIIDNPTGSVVNFGTGDGNIVMVYDSGWESIPAEITEIAEVMVARAWRGRENGESDQIGTDEYGQPVISRYLSPRDRSTLRSYRPQVVVTG